MCLETISTTCNNGGINQGNSERIRTPSTQSLSATSNTYPKLKITKRTNSYTFTDENERLASKDKYEMAEKKKKLPPGYVNVSTKSLSDIGLERDTKLGKDSVYYVNAGIVKTEDVIPRNQVESPTSQSLENVVDTSAFKFELDPYKSEIPIDDSSALSPIISPPLQQKLSPQKTSASNQINSHEFPSNSHSQCIRNEISRLDNLCGTDEINEKESNPERCHFQKYSEPEYESSCLESLNQEKIFFEEARSQPSSPLRIQNTYQNTQPSQAVSKGHHLASNTRQQADRTSDLSFTSSSAQNNNELSMKQYIHSAGGGCVSPVDDASPHILITSQNCFPYGKQNKFVNPTENFSVNNPFLPLIRKEKEGRNTNPFMSTESEGNEFSHQGQLHTIPQNSLLNQASFRSSQDVTNAMNNSIFDPNITSASIFPTHIHHHHFYHPNNQPRVGWNETALFQEKENVDSNQHVNDSIAINRPGRESYLNRSQNNQMSPNVDLNHNMQLVLKPKKEELSYKDLEKILLLNKALLKKCGWYYGKMRADESTALLADTEPGTFLVRDSSDPKYWFSLSMQRGNAKGNDISSQENSGPTSIRIHFVNGKFQLDAEDRIRSLMPEFDTIIDLVQFYVSTSLHELKQVQKNTVSCEDSDIKSFQNAKSKTLWVDSSGKMYQTIFLAYPLYRKDTPQSLSQICRLTINKSIVSKITNSFSDNIYQNQQYHESISTLNLPGRIQEFLHEYPNTV